MKVRNRPTVKPKGTNSESIKNKRKKKKKYDQLTQGLPAVLSDEIS